MVKVRATSASRVYNKALREFHRVVDEGEVFEVTEERFKYLNKDNIYNIAFVELFDKQEPVQEVEECTCTNECKECTCGTQETYEPDIFVIEPGEDPVQVDENLEPITTPKSKPASKTPKKKSSKNTTKSTKTTKKSE